ncbi:MAG: nitroreductase family protein [Thermonemataceae bacterium]
MKDSKEINGFLHDRYERTTYEVPEMLQRSKAFYEWLDTRRTVRDFSDKPIPKAVIEQLLLAASTAPSGAHKQPWTFCVVANPDLKKQIRIEAEKEEYESYHGRMGEEWLQDLAPIGTDWQKPFLEIAPYLIVIFKRIYELDEEQNKQNNYYVNESVGLAAGLLLAAIHEAGLVALTHTPSPMNFLSKILARPANERPFLLIPVGYPAEEVYVPQLTRKKLPDISVFYE